MKVKEKDGINIEVKTGNFEDLKDFLSDLILETKEQKEDFKLFNKIDALFKKQSLEGQRATIDSLIDIHINSIKKDCCKCKEDAVKDALKELKEDANNKGDC